jgi:hypothetical protein
MDELPRLARLATTVDPTAFPSCFGSLSSIGSMIRGKTGRAWRIPADPPSAGRNVRETSAV